MKETNQSEHHAEVRRFFTGKSQVWHPLCNLKHWCGKRPPTETMEMVTKDNSLQRNQLASLLVKASPVATVLTDSQGIIEAVNGAAEDCFGYKEPELLGQSIGDIFSGDHLLSNTSHRVRILSKVSDPNPAEGLFLEAQRKDGSTFSAKVTLHPLSTDSDDLRLANVIDLSKTSGSDDSWRKEGIQGERLEGVRQTVSGMAHKSCNALQRAQSCLELLQLDLATQSDLMDLAHHIGEALQDIHRNYEEVKNYAAPITLKRTPVNLASLCQATFDELIESLGIDGPRLAIQCSAACQEVKLDANRIRDVFRHILENAIHASGNDGLIEFHCDCPSTTNASHICITLRDHGKGLTTDAIDHTFDPFFTTKTKGTGLGLAVCRRIVEAHHGTIQASNHPEGGTLVEISFPSSINSHVDDSELPQDHQR